MAAWYWPVFIELAGFESLQWPVLIWISPGEHHKNAFPATVAARVRKILQASVNLALTARDTWVKRQRPQARRGGENASDNAQHAYRLEREHG